MMAVGEIQFLEPIIQRFQSFLAGKEAARTTLVSKSWHSAWLTRPNLDFDDTHFRKHRYNVDFDDTHFREIQSDDLSGVDEFSEYAKKTIERYEKSNLKIESFKLCMEINCNGIANELIVRALRIGATHLSFRLNNNHRDRSHRDRSFSFVLPPEVFGADNLVGLSVSGCKINLDDVAVIKCRRLESLILGDGVDIKVDTFSNIISGCPSIEKLSLLSDVCSRYDLEIILWEGQEARKEQRAQREVAAAAIAVGLVDNLLHRLRCLELSYVSFQMLRLGDLLSRFPLLKDFTLYLKRNGFSKNKKEIQISNCSIERVKLGLEDDNGCYYTSEERRWRPMVKFDVPSVRKFTFEGNTIPWLSFMSTPSREWESHVSIKCVQHRGFTTFWFSELSEFLTKLSQSKTHLSLNVRGFFDYKVGDNSIQGLRKHELENLTIDTRGLPPLNCYALLDGLFRLCRPKVITPYYEDDPDKRQYVEHPYDHENIRKTSIDFLCQILEQGINVKVSSPTQFMYDLNDLEEVKAQAFDVDEWRPIPLESLLDADADAPQQRVRLLLKWKPS